MLKYRNVKNTYTIGDKIPISGESYSYPESFDILVLRDHTAVKIRDSIVSEIISFDDYNYENYPVVNGRGFEIKADSQEDIQNLLNEYDDADLSDKFFAKWMNFSTYRKVTLISGI